MRGEKKAPGRGPQTILMLLGNAGFHIITSEKGMVLTGYGAGCLPVSRWSAPVTRQHKGTSR